MKNTLLLASILLIASINVLEAQRAFKVFEKSKNAYGIIDNSGDQIIPAEFDDIRYINESYQCSKNGNVGVISSNGKILLPIKFDSLLFSNCAKPEVYVASVNNKWMLYRGDGKKLTKPVFNLVSAPLENKIALKKRNELLEFDLKNESFAKINQGKFDNYDFFYEKCMDMSFVDGSFSAKLVSENGLYGYKKNNKWIVRPEYQSLKRTVDEYWIGRKQGKYGLISINGEELTEFIYDNVSTLGYFAILKKDQLYGVYNVTERIMIVPIRYDKIEFVE